MFAYQRSLTSEASNLVKGLLVQFLWKWGEAEQLSPPGFLTLWPQCEWYTHLKQPSVASQKFSVNLR